MIRVCVFTTAMLVALLAAGCSDSPTAPVLVDVADDGPTTLHVEIAGPRALSSRGAYAWQAAVENGSGDMAYEWDVSGLPAAILSSGRNGPVFELLLDQANSLLFEIGVTVRSGDQVAHATAYVSFCPTPFPVDDCAFILEKY